MRAVPSPNPRHGGVTLHEREAGLIGGWTAAGRAELGTPGINRVTFDSRPPLRRGGRGPLGPVPLPNPRHGGVAPRERRPGIIRGLMATGRAELGRSGFNRATSVSRLPLRLGGRGPTRAGPSPNPRHGGVAPCEGGPG